MDYHTSNDKYYIHRPQGCRSLYHLKDGRQIWIINNDLESDHIQYPYYIYYTRGVFYLILMFLSKHNFIKNNFIGIIY